MALVSVYPVRKDYPVPGDPGEGKTTFIFSLLSILSTGGTLPSSDVSVSGNAIYQNTEDDSADIIKPRLERHAADCSKICFISKQNDAVQTLRCFSSAKITANLWPAGTIIT